MNDIRHRSLSNFNSKNNDINFRKSGTSSIIDESFLSHQRRKIIEHKNSDAVISNRSLSRANKRASSKQSSSRGSYSDNQQALLNAPQSPGLSIKSDNQPLILTGKQNTENVIEEQDLEETLGDDLVLQCSLQNTQINNQDKTTSQQSFDKQQLDTDNNKDNQVKQQVEQNQPEQQKKVITFDMLQSLQQTKQAEKLIKLNQTNHQFSEQQNDQQTNDKPLTQSWEKAIQDTSQSFVNDLFSKFGGMSFGSSSKTKVPQVVQQSGYNKKIVLNVQQEQEQEIQTAKKVVPQNIETEQVPQALFQESISTLQINQTSRIDIIGNPLMVKVSQDDYQDQLSQQSDRSKLQTQEISVKLLSNYENNTINSQRPSIVQEQNTDYGNFISMKKDYSLIQQTLSLVNIESKKFAPSQTLNITVQNSLSTKSMKQKITPGKSDSMLDEIDNKSLKSQSMFSVQKDQNQHLLLEMSFNNQLSQSKKNTPGSPYKEISFQGSNAKLFQNKGSDIIENLTPTSNNGNFDFESYQQTKNLTDDTLDLLFYFIIKDELKQACNIVEKETEEQVLKVSMYRAEDAIVESLMNQHIESLKQDMYQKFLDNLVSQAQDKVIEKIIGEYILLFELATPENTAAYITDQLEQKMVNKLIDFLDKEDTINSERLQNASDMINIRSIMNYNSKLSNHEDSIQNQERSTSKKFKIKKRTKIPTKSKQNHNSSQANGMVDLEFFEKCFFGKSLHMKDQLIFKIYANELLEIIKDNFSNTMKKKYKQMIKNQSKRQKSKLKSRQTNQHRSPSPQDPYFNPSQLLQYKFENPSLRKSLTPTNEILRGGKQEFLLVQDYYNTINNFKNTTSSQQFSEQNLQNQNSQPISINIIDQNKEKINFYSGNDQKRNSSTKNFQQAKQSTQDSKEQNQTIIINAVQQQNPSQQQTEFQGYSLKMKKKRQPSQIRRRTIDLQRTSQPKSPGKQQQLKILQNLESQMKDIIKNDRPIKNNQGFFSINSGGIKQIKLKKRVANTTIQSLHNSPRTANTSIIKNNQQINIIIAPKELPAVKKVNRYKLASAQNNSVILDQNQQDLQAQQSYLNDATLHYKNPLSQDGTPENKSNFTRTNFGFIDNYLLSSTTSQNLISQGNSRDINSRGSILRPDTSDILNANSGIDFQQLRTNSLGQNVLFAPQQNRSISVNARALNASQLFKKYKGGGNKQKFRQQTTQDMIGLDLNATTIASKFKRPMSKGRFMHQGIKQLNSTFNQMLLSQNNDGYYELPLNSDRYRNRSSFLKQSSIKDGNDYQTNYEYHKAQQLQSLNSNIRKINQNQFLNNGKNVLQPPQLKSQIYKQANQTQSFIDRQNLSGQVSVQNKNAPQEYDFMPLQREDTQSQQYLHQQQESKQEFMSNSMNTHGQYSKFSIPQLNIQQKLSVGQVATQGSSPLYSSNPLHSQQQIVDLGINSDKIKSRIGIQKQNQTDINLDQYMEL